MADEGTILITRSNRGMPQSRGAVCQRGARGFILFLVNFRVVLDASLFSFFFFLFLFLRSLLEEGLYKSTSVDKVVKPTGRLVIIKR